jgi:regulatory protein
VRLSDIEWNPRRTQARLRFDDGLEVTLTAATMRETGPRSGQTYGRGDVEAWERLDARVRARDGALRLLDHRGRSRGELVRGLVRRGHAAELAAEVADGLAKTGLVDDAAYAESYVRGRIARRPRGSRALVLELRGRLVSESDAEAAVARVLADEGLEEGELARQATRGWLSRQAPGEVARARAGDEETRERLYRRARWWLERRGFTGDVAHAQVSGALEDRG